MNCFLYNYWNLYRMLTPKITAYDTKIIPAMYEQWFMLVTIYDNKMFWHKEEKKQVKSRALTTESNKGISYLKKQRENIDNWIEIHYPDFIDDRKQWSDFINHWTQKNTEDWKMHAEKQKTFEIRARWATWHKDKKQTKSNVIW